MRFVIAEKPSVANDLARVLDGPFHKHDGYFEGPGYLISWAVGHMLELAEPEDYDPGLKGWLLESLPILPREFRRRPRPGQSKQLQLLKKLARRDDVEALINACDAAREGELIFREIQQYAGVDKPVYRLWLQSMTPAALREAFRRLEPAARYDGLGAAAFSRAEADWLIGMNATRGITKRLRGRREKGAKGVWSAGRVQTPTLALLVHRELKVLSHVPRPYWRLRGRFQAGDHEYEALYRASRGSEDGEKLWSQDQALALQQACRGKETRVTEELSESVRPAPPLYSLTGLQKEANRRYGLSASRTLAAAQRLYENHKVLTYPRTDSDALPADYRPQVERIVGEVAGGAFAGFFHETERSAALVEAAQEIRRAGPRNARRNFDDQRISDHFAIIPTGSAPENPLGGDDAKVLELVVRRFLAAFLGPSTWQRVVRETAVAGALPDGGAASFFVESRRLVQPGWQLVDQRPGKSETLPGLGVPPGAAAAGRVLELAVEEDATRPPARYTEASLLKAMEEASDLDLDLHDEIEEDGVVAALKVKGLGTPATRAEIIESLIEKEYASRSGKSLRATAKGITLIDFLERVAADRLASAELTAEMEFHLHQVERGQRRRDQYMHEVEESVRDLVEKLRGFSYEELYRRDPPLGPCPVDGAPVMESVKNYRCSTEARADRYEVALKIPAKDAPLGLAQAVAGVAAALEKAAGVAEVSATSKRTSAVVTVRLDDKSGVEAAAARLRQAAERALPAGALKEIGVSPVEPEGCGWTLWKEFRGRYVNRPVAEKLLREGDSGPIEGFVSMRGETYAGRLHIGPDHKLVFEPVKGYKGGGDDTQVAPELVSYPVDPAPLAPCPRCGAGAIVETPTHFACRRPGEEQGCGVQLPRTVCKRPMSRADVLPYFQAEPGCTDWIENFVSKRERPFTARLVRQANGRHRFEFKPREGGAGRARRQKTSKKKVVKKLS